MRIRIIAMFCVIIMARLSWAETMITPDSHGEVPGLSVIPHGQWMLETSFGDFDTGYVTAMSFPTADLRRGMADRGEIQLELPTLDNLDHRRACGLRPAGGHRAGREQ